MSKRYVAQIEASKIYKYMVRFFDGEPVAWYGNAERYGYENEVRWNGCDTLWGAKRAARKGLQHLERMDALNNNLGATK